MRKFTRKRITVVTGHYGSGKSEFAVNLALCHPVDLFIDLDIINPYFRSREMEAMLNEHGIDVVGSTLKNAKGSDLPYVSPAAFRPFLDSSISAILDLGGDVAGARLMRQFEGNIPEQDLEVLCVVNTYREKTATVEAIRTMVHQIETSAGVIITGFVNNTNQLRATTWDDLKQGEFILREAAMQLGIPIRYYSYPHTLKKNKPLLLGEPLELKLFLRQAWL